VGDDVLTFYTAKHSGKTVDESDTGPEVFCWNTELLFN